MQQVSQKSPGGHLAKGNQSVQQAKVTGLGARAPRGLGLDPKFSQLPPVFLRSEKSAGGRQAKGWETAEAAAVDIGAWREAGTGYPPLPPPFPGCKGERRGFSPSPLLKPSNTPPKVGGQYWSSTRSDMLNSKPQNLEVGVVAFCMTGALCSVSPATVSIDSSTLTKRCSSQQSV